VVKLNCPEVKIMFRLALHDHCEIDDDAVWQVACMMFHIDGTILSCPAISPLDYGAFYGLKESQELPNGETFDFFIGGTA
jgi:hypothetical protein